jgi:hypothetical protein
VHVIGDSDSPAFPAANKIIASYLNQLMDEYYIRK